MTGVELFLGSVAFLGGLLIAYDDAQEQRYRHWARGYRRWLRGHCHERVVRHRTYPGGWTREYW